MRLFEGPITFAFSDAAHQTRVRAGLRAVPGESSDERNVTHAPHPVHTQKRQELVSLRAPQAAGVSQAHSARPAADQSARGMVKVEGVTEFLQKVIDAQVVAYAPHTSPAICQSVRAHLTEQVAQWQSESRATAAWCEYVSEPLLAHLHHFASTTRAGRVFFRTLPWQLWQLMSDPAPAFLQHERRPVHCNRHLRSLRLAIDSVQPGLLDDVPGAPGEPVEALLASWAASVPSTDCNVINEFAVTQEGRAYARAARQFRTCGMVRGVYEAGLAVGRAAAQHFSLAALGADSDTRALL